MKIPDFKNKGNSGVLDEKELPTYEVRKVDKITLLGSRTSETLLLVGFLLIFLNNMGILAPGTYFGAFSWVTATVFAIGLIINFFMIPFLYFSSFKNFRKENSCWDRETFLILPLFFFGTFFLYGSQISLAWTLLAISVILIAVIHYKFLRLSWKLLLRSSNEAFLMQQEYFLSLKYLTVYYFLLLLLLIFLNPLQMMFYWVRLHV
jgi:hypothetical protein